MICIYCAHDTRVINSRHQKRANSVWRRRQCLECEGVFTTLETPELASAMIVKKATALEPFSRDKLFISVYDSLRHRSDALSASTELTRTIIGKLLPQSVSATLTIQQITETTASVLGNFDPIAHTHYTAFHPLG